MFLRLLLLDEFLIVRVDDGNSEEDTSSRTDGTDEVGEDGEGTDAHSSEGGSSGDVSLEHGVHVLVSDFVNEVALVSEVTGDVINSGSGDLNPGLGEEGAGNQDEGDVEDSMEGISGDFEDIPGRGDVIGESSDGDGMTSGLNVLPLAEELDQEVGLVAFVEDLGEEVEVGDKGGLEDDRDVRRVEELDGVGSVSAGLVLVGDLDFVFESLEVDDDEEHDDGGHQVEEVGRGGSVEGLVQSGDFVGSGQEHVHGGHDGTFVLNISGLVGDGEGGEGLPHDVLADVHSDEQGNSGTDSVSFLENFVQKKHDDTGDYELDDNQVGVEGSEVG